MATSPSSTASSPPGSPVSPGAALGTGKVDSLLLHVAVWNNDLLWLGQLMELKKYNLAFRDQKGYTAYLLALALGRREAAELLLAGGSDAKDRLPQGWEAIQLATLTANPGLIRDTVLATLRETDAAWQRRIHPLLSRLEKLLPNDTVTIYKRGSNFRMDSTLLGMEKMRWQRGQISVLLCGLDSAHPGSIFILDRGEKTAANLRKALLEPKDKEIQEWVTKLLTKKLKQSDFWSRDTTFDPVYERGWLGRSSVLKRDNVGEFENCPVYAMKGLKVKTTSHPKLLSKLNISDWWKDEYSTEDKSDNPTLRIEREEEERKKKHGSGGGGGGGGAGAGAFPNDEDEEDDGLAPLKSALRRLKSSTGQTPSKGLADHLLEGGLAFQDEGVSEVAVRGNSVVEFTPEEYFGRTALKGIEEEAAEAEKEVAKMEKPADRRPLKSDRQHVAVFQQEHLSYSEKKFKEIKACFSEEFPLKAQDMLPIAEVMARTGTHFENFKQFFSTKFPADAGFPVRFEIPVFPTIKATVTFDNAVATSPSASLFTIPDDFHMGAYVDRGFLSQM